MAVQSKQGPTQAPNKTPPPDEISRPRAGSPAGYGQNGPQPSSVDPGKAMLSPLAANLKSSVDDGGVLDTVIARGTYKSQVVTDDKQLRQIAAGNVPTHSGTSGAAAGPKVPAKIGASDGQPVRKPGA